MASHQSSMHCANPIQRFPPKCFRFWTQSGTGVSALCRQQLPPTTPAMEGARLPLGFSSSSEKDTLIDAISSANEQRELKTKQKTTNHPTPPKKEETTCEGIKDFPAYSVWAFLLRLSPRSHQGFVLVNTGTAYSRGHRISIIQAGLLA